MRRRLLPLVVFCLCAARASATAESPAQVEVVVVGAGLSGLATAYKLKKAGVPCHILELSPHIGGRVRTVHYRFGEEEVYADSGMEEYWESNPAVPLLKELGLPLRADVAMSSIVLDGALNALGDEEQPEYMERLFGAEGAKALEDFKAGLEPVVAELRAGPPSPERLKLKGLSFAEWVRARKLPPKVAEWVRVSVECEIGTEWDKISALDGIAEMHIFLGGGEKSYRVLGGNEKFTAALADAVGRAYISTGHRVTRVVSDGEGAYVYYLDLARNRAGRVRAAHVVSTIPLFRLFEVQFEPPLSTAKQEAIDGLQWGSYFKAHVFLPPSAGSYWTRDGASILPILSDSELGVIYDGNPDQEGRTRILSLLVCGQYAEAFNLMPLDSVRERLKAGLDRMFPGLGAQIRGIEFHRYHPRAIAAWPVGRSRYDALSQAVRTPENHVYLAGDFTESSHSSGALVSSERVVRQILEARAAAGPARKETP